MKNTVKAITVDIYSSHLGNSSNGGISSRHNTAYLIHPKGNHTLDKNNLPENTIQVITRQIRGEEHKHAEPVHPTKKGNVGYMSGGSIVYTCDSRFRDLSRYPLTLHDRQETTKEYETLSR